MTGPGLQSLHLSGDRLMIDINSDGTITMTPNMGALEHRVIGQLLCNRVGGTISMRSWLLTWDLHEKAAMQRWE